MKKWSEVKEETLTEEQRERVDERVREELVKITLAELRNEFGFTQSELAEIMDVSQPELSRLERSRNPMLATLRRYVEALGGELEVSVVFEGKRKKIETM